MTVPASGVAISFGVRGSSPSDLHGECENNNLDLPARTPRVHLFFGLGAEEINRIAAHARSLRKGRGEYVYMPGTRSYSYGNISTSNPSLVLGIKYSIGKGRRTEDR